MEHNSEMTKTEDGENFAIQAESKIKELKENDGIFISQKLNDYLKNSPSLKSYVKSDYLHMYLRDENEKVLSVRTIEDKTRHQAENMSSGSDVITKITDENIARNASTVATFLKNNQKQPNINEVTFAKETSRNDTPKGKSKQREANASNVAVFIKANQKQPNVSTVAFARKAPLKDSPKEKSKPSETAAAENSSLSKSSDSDDEIFKKPFPPKEKNTLKRKLGSGYLKDRSIDKGNKCKSTRAVFRL